LSHWRDVVSHRLTLRVQQPRRFVVALRLLLRVMPFVLPPDVVDRDVVEPSVPGRTGAIRRELVFCAAVGCVLAAASAVGTYDLYPEQRVVWPIPVLAGASVLVLVFLYRLSVRRAGQTAGNSLFLGYVVTMLAGAAIVIVAQILPIWHSLVASNIGY